MDTEHRKEPAVPSGIFLTNVCSLNIGMRKRLASSNQECKVLKEKQMTKFKVKGALSGPESNPFVIEFIAGTGSNLKM